MRGILDGDGGWYPTSIDKNASTDWLIDKQQTIGSSRDIFFDCDLSQLSPPQPPTMLSNFLSLNAKSSHNSVRAVCGKHTKNEQ